MSKDKESLKRFARRNPNPLRDWATGNGRFSESAVEQIEEELDREHENQSKGPEWALHELCNIDKHRTLNLAQFFLKSAEYHFFRPRDARIDLIGNTFQRGPLKRGEIQCHFQCVALGREKVETYLNLILSS